MSAPLAEQEPLAFAQLLLGLIDEGRRTATYKLALLLALLDCSVLQTDAEGRPGRRISTRTLAARVVHLYWPQVQPFSLDGAPAKVLSQSSQSRSVTVDAVAHLREVARARRITTLHGAASSLPAEYETCLDRVELNFVQMPLGKLQRPAGVVGDAYPRFLYPDGAFTESVTLARLRARPLEVVATTPSGTTSPRWTTSRASPSGTGPIWPRSRCRWTGRSTPQRRAGRPSACTRTCRWAASCGCPRVSSRSSTRPVASARSSCWRPRRDDARPATGQARARPDP